MYYVELLRAKRALIIAGVLLVIFFAIAVTIRLSLHDGNVRDWPKQLTGSPTAHVSRTVLPDGSIRSVVDDPQRSTHAIIVQHPNGTFDMDVTEPNTGARRHHMSMGNLSQNESISPDGKTAHTVMHFKPEVPEFYWAVLFVMSAPIGLLVASILGGAPAKENDGHLDLAWTKPFSREHYAVAAFAIDVAAIVVAQVAMILVTLLATLMFFVPRFAAEQGSGPIIGVALVGPFAWYAMITAASSSFKRGPGMIMGILWVAAVLVPSVSGILAEPAQVNAIAAGFHAVFKALSYLDPFTYMSFSVHQAQVKAQSGFTMGANLLILAALVVVYLAVSLVQWRRVEA